MMQEKSLVARAARERESVIVNDVRAEAGFLPNPNLPETRAEMAVPLLVGSDLLGVLDVQADRVGRFTAEDANIQAALAAQVAIALQNARQYADAQRRATREQLVNEISQRIRSAVSVEGALETAVKALGYHLDVKSVAVKLNPEGGLPRETNFLPPLPDRKSTGLLSEKTDPDEETVAKRPSSPPQERNGRAPANGHHE